MHWKRTSKEVKQIAEVKGHAKDKSIEGLRILRDGKGRNINWTFGQTF